MQIDIIIYETSLSNMSNRYKGNCFYLSDVNRQRNLFTHFWHFFKIKELFLSVKFPTLSVESI